MNMFTNYEYIPADYVPRNREAKPLATPVVKLPLEEYNAKGEFIGYSWKYNDTVLLEFQTTGTVLYHNPDAAEDAETYLEGKKFLIEVFNFRYEVMFSQELDASANIKYYLPENLRKILIPNTYAIQVTLIDEENEVRQVLISRNDLKVFVR